MSRRMTEILLVGIEVSIVEACRGRDRDLTEDQYRHDPLVWTETLDSRLTVLTVW